MKTKFKKQPVCEVCGTEEAISFSAMAVKDGFFTEWKICGPCTSDSETYYIEIDKFFDSPASTVDWLAHMHEKKMDWQSFMNMMRKFRAETESFGKI